MKCSLVDIDENTLAELTMVALHDASAAEVTPPLTDGDHWTPERIAWFEDYHRTRRSGLAGEHGEATWAIAVSGSPVGAARLKRIGPSDIVETGIWLARSARGSGVAGAAMAAVIDKAIEHGASALVADTAATNHSAQALMRKAGFVLGEAADGRVRGQLDLFAADTT